MKFCYNMDYFKNFRFKHEFLKPSKRNNFAIFELYASSRIA